MLTLLGAVLLGLPLALGLYAYFGYPLLLLAASRFRRPPRRLDDPPVWPFISISVPAYNEEAAIAGTLESLLALDYPPERRHIVVVSDASTDRTDEIVQGFSNRGVTLVRVPQRAGKTASENAAVPMLKGEIVVNTDATIRILPQSLRPLIRAFQDASVGVASGRDVSVGDLGAERNRSESGYVGYEMWIRGLETRLGSIVGASGCFYAIRRPLIDAHFPEALSRDFASVLQVRAKGYRGVSVDEAICLVARTRDLRTEYRRKVRTMARGLETLWYKRALLNPFRYGGFAFMLASHKLVRWLVFLTLPLILVGLALMAISRPWVSLVLAGALLVLGLGVIALRWPTGKRLPGPLAFLGFAVASSAAGLAAWLKALRGERNPIWEPTRRPALTHRPDSGAVENPGG